MREGVAISYNEEFEPNVESVSVDYEDPVEFVLQQVDAALKEFGLEIITHENVSDQLAFSIAPRG